MPTNHAAVAALPISGDADKTLLRNAITARMPFVLADADDVTDLVAVDPDTAAAIIDILFLGRLFHYDATDTTTANDGITCLVTSDGRRYKLSDGSDVFAYSVLDNAIVTPPGSPTIGDAYLIASGATGAWAGKANYIGTYTRRGWEFINFGIGRFIYVEDTDTYYHKDSGGAWVAGFGNATFNANSIPLSAAINFGKRLIVENQTTNAPPGTPTIGDAYIIGSSPTGSWAGHATKIAICEDGSTFTIYTPTNGWSAYDKTRNNNFTFNGSAWISAAGIFADTKTATVVTTSGTGAVIPVDDTIPQIGEGTEVISTTFTPKSATNKLRVRFEAIVSTDSGPRVATAALFLNSIASAIAAKGIHCSTTNALYELALTHEFVPGTTSEITLSVRIGVSVTSPGAIYWNGISAGRYYGSMMQIVLTIDEINA